MAIQFACPTCNQPIEVGLESVGKVYRCQCGSKMRIPDPNANKTGQPSPQTAAGSAKPKKLSGKGPKPVVKKRLQPKKLGPQNPAPLQPNSNPVSPAAPQPITPVAGNPVAPINPVAPLSPVPVVQPVTPQAIPQSMPVNPVQPLVPNHPVQPIQPVAPIQPVQAPATGVMPGMPQAPVGGNPVRVVGPANPTANSMANPAPVAGAAPSFAAQPLTPSGPVQVTGSAPANALGIETPGRSGSRSSSRSSRGRGRRKKNNSALAWWMVGGSVIVVLFALAIFFFVQNQRENDRLEREKARQADKQNAANAQASRTTPANPGSPSRSSPAVASSSVAAAKPSTPKRLVMPEDNMAEVTTGVPKLSSERLLDGADMGGGDMNATPDVMDPNFSDSAAVPTSGATGIAMMVGQFIRNPNGDTLHKQILEKPVEDAWTELESADDKTKAAYLLLRMRYFLGDKELPARIKECSFQSLVDAAKVTFWREDISTDSNVFLAAEFCDSNAMHNALRIAVGANTDGPPAQVEIIRQQAVLFKANDKYFVANMGRHVYSDQLERQDTRGVLDKVASCVGVAEAEMDDDQVTEWKANNFRFPIWAETLVDKTVAEHFGMTAPSSKQWSIETFDLNGKIVRDPVDMQKRVLD